VLFPVAADLFRHGAAPAPLITLLTAKTLVSPIRTLTYEAPLLGWPLTLARFVPGVLLRRSWAARPVAVRSVQAMGMSHPERAMAVLRIVVGTWFLKAVWTKLGLGLAAGVIPYPPSRRAS